MRSVIHTPKVMNDRHGTVPLSDVTPYRADGGGKASLADAPLSSRTLSPRQTMRASSAPTSHRLAPLPTPITATDPATEKRAGSNKTDDLASDRRQGDGDAKTQMMGEAHLKVQDQRPESSAESSVTVPKSNPATGEISMKLLESATPWLHARLLALTGWGREEPRNHYTIQLMTLPLIRAQWFDGLLVAHPEWRNQIFIRHLKPQQGTENYMIFFGRYDDYDQAQEIAKSKLPETLSGHRPYVRNIPGLVKRWYGTFPLSEHKIRDAIKALQADIIKQRTPSN